MSELNLCTCYRIVNQSISLFRSLVSLFVSLQLIVPLEFLPALIAFKQILCHVNLKVFREIGRLRERLVTVRERTFKRFNTGVGTFERIKSKNEFSSGTQGSMGRT